MGWYKGRINYVDDVPGNQRSKNRVVKREVPNEVEKTNNVCTMFEKYSIAK